MTDIYVGSGRRRWGRPVLLAAGVAALAGWWWAGRPSSEPVPAPDQGNPLHPSDKTDPADPAPLPAVPTPVPEAERPSLEEIRALVEAEELHRARDLAYTRLEGLPRGPARLSTEQVLGDLNIRLAFHKIPMREKVTHVVAPGDTLGKLAQTYHTTPELIARSNRIERNLIRVGDTLRILDGSFDVTVNKTRNDLLVTLNGRFFKRYAVGTGTHGSTPAGDYLITLRLRHPVWYRPDGERFAYGHPENLLGTHYLKLDAPGIGIHGTWEPDSIGSQSSAGCVRLRNEMIEELYNLLPEGTPVRIEN